MPGTRLFVYGTLMDAARLRTLTGHAFPHQPATLTGFVRIAPPGGYPYVVPRAGGRVEGLLLEEVDPASLGALDAYEDEGRLYRRTAVEVQVGSRRVGCDVYVGKPARPPGA